MKTLKLQVVLSVFFLLVVSSQPCFAVHFVTDPSVMNLDCNGYNVTFGGTFMADRDNTGNNSEVLEVYATDGLGNVIFHSVSAPLPIGQTRTTAVGSTPWQAAPKANPLTRKFISVSGNGLSTEVVRTVTGTCNGLPDASTVPITGDIDGLWVFDSPSPAGFLMLRENSGTLLATVLWLNGDGWSAFFGPVAGKTAHLSTLINPDSMLDFTATRTADDLITLHIDKCTELQPSACKGMVGSVMQIKKLY